MIAAIPCKIARFYVDGEGATSAQAEDGRIELALNNGEKASALKPQKKPFIELTIWADTAKTTIELPIPAACELLNRLAPVVRSMLPPPEPAAQPAPEART